MNNFFGAILHFCYTGNYVVTLLLFALIMQIPLCGLGVLQQRNMIKQAKLRPKEMAIRKKYAGRNDKATMQKCQNEIMQLYQQEGYNQMLGCLPMLLQLIIIFPIYQVVIRPLEFITHVFKDDCVKVAEQLGIEAKSAYQIDIISKIKENPALANGTALEGVELPDVTLFGVDLGQTPWDAFGTAAWILVLVPVINLALMYLSQFLSKKFTYQNTQQEAMNNSSMKIMMYVLPLMTFFITFRFSAAIGIYWIFRTILSIGQQFAFYKIMPYPVYTEEDYRKAEKEMKNKKKGTSKEIIYPEKEIRSLHHIDDDE